jgi:AcrR family transcriptional regulator
MFLIIKVYDNLWLNAYCRYPPMLKPRRRQGDSTKDHPTRARLITAAVDQIRVRGTYDIDVDGLLGEVGVTKGSLYHHFDSVNDLTIAALLHIFSSGIEETTQWFSAMRNECSAADEVIGRIRVIIDETQNSERRWVRAQRARILSLAKTHPELGVHVAQLQQQLTDDVTEVMIDFQKRGWLRKDVDAKSFSVFIQAFTLGRIIDDVVEEPHHVDSQEWINVVDKVAETFFITTNNK